MISVSCHHATVFVVLSYKNDYNPQQNHCICIMFVCNIWGYEKFPFRPLYCFGFVLQQQQVKVNNTNLNQTPRKTWIVRQFFFTHIQGVSKLMFQTQGYCSLGQNESSSNRGSTPSFRILAVSVCDLYYKFYILKTAWSSLTNIRTNTLLGRLRFRKKVVK